MASFQAKTGRDRLRVIPKKKSYRSDPFHPDQEQGIPKKITKKFKKLKNIILASFQAKAGRDRLRVIQKKKLSFRSIPTRSGIGNSRKIAKKFKKLKNIIMASFQAKTGQDRLRVIPKKKKVIIRIHSNPTRNRE